MLFYPTSYFLLFHLTSRHFALFFCRFTCIFFTNVVVFFSLRSSALPSVLFLFLTPNWFHSLLSLSSLLKASLLPLRCSSGAILDLYCLRKKVRSVARSAKEQKVRCGVVVALPGIPRRKKKMRKIGNVSRHIVQ